MAKSIMIQGTMSNAGKSLLAVGLCRIFRQDGYKVAPFKSQNMALNSYITDEGLEMGRAQVMQAEAASIAPSVLMNPILLKPTSDTGSQVIVNGEVYGNLSAREYFAQKRSLIPQILSAYEQLDDIYDIIVIEGAGSPAEINLKSDDIVNMGLAELVDAPVLLVGDIDRGGVFAQLLGTMMLLEESESARVKGLIINKFRGDVTLLDSGIEMLKERIQVPVIGVTPYMNVDIEDEDSLSERFTSCLSPTSADVIDIAVLRLPHISNFTDFYVLEHRKGVSLRYIHNLSELHDPDMIILPGTKNTIQDLLWLRQNGLEAAIQKAAHAGKVIFGVCGGYQMLGNSLQDPDHQEQGGTVSGLQLLPVTTVFETKKTRTRVRGTFGQLQGTLKGLSGIQFEGYEIHMGRTAFDSNCSAMSRVENLLDSSTYQDGANLSNVYGTYIHGIFDAEAVSTQLIRSLAQAKGISADGFDTIDYKTYKESQYDLLADTLRSHMDMERIYSIMGITRP